jgi:enoyl-CoA hydratase
VRDGVAWLDLARPATGNTLDAEMMADLAAASERIEHDETVRVAVLAAQGRTFCAGLPDGMPWLPPAWPDGIRALSDVTKPVVACLTGPVRGWGLGLALACDLRVAGTGTVLQVAELGRGILPGGGVTQRLTRLVGPSRALAMLLLGEGVSARTALAWGLVSRVVPTARLRPAAAAMAGALARHGPDALRFAKEAVVRALDLPLDDGIRLEQDLYVLLQTTADRQEGVQAFLEHRPARYDGR